MANYLALKNNYVVNRFVWDGIAPYTYPDEDCIIMEDVTNSAGIGMWYNGGVFTMPIEKPIDLPAELDYLYNQEITDTEALNIILDL